MDSSRRTTKFRFWLWLINLVGVIVPRRLRADWRQEWEAELRYREALLADWERLDWRNKFDLLWRGTSAFWDALWLQQLRWEDEVLQDLRYGARTLLQHKAFTFVAVLSLALGIGANTAIFSVVNAVLLRPLPYKDAEKLMWIWQTRLPETPSANPSPANFLDWQKQNTVFEQIEAVTVRDFNLIEADNPERINGMLVTHGFFSMLGLGPQIGRDFLAAENNIGQNNVAILGYAFWQRRFAGDQSILNHTVRLDDHTYTVIGVLPPNTGLRFRDTDIWIPITFTDEQIRQRDRGYLNVFGRLKSGINIERAQAEMNLIADRLAKESSTDNKAWGVKIDSLQYEAFENLRPVLWILLGAALFVLLIACTNVAGLLLARATARQKEIAVRTALGAGRWRIVRQLLTESMLLSLAGGVIGVAIAYWSVGLLVAMADFFWPRVMHISLDAQMLVFTLLVTLITGLGFGIVPALQVSKPGLSEIIKDAGRGLSESRRQISARSILIVIELAMSLVLMVGAGLLIRSLTRLQNVDPGFRADSVLTASISLPEKKYSDNRQQAAFYTKLIDNVRHLPGVQTVGASSNVPFSDAVWGFPQVTFEIEGHSTDAQGNRHNAGHYAVSQDYFAALGISLLNGRIFNDHDMANTHGVVIINRTMARSYFQNENPVGKRVILRNETVAAKEIVGVVNDVKDSLDQDKGWPQIYEPYTQQPLFSMTLVVRTTGEPTGLSQAIRKEVLKLDKEQPVFKIDTLDHLISASTVQQRLIVLMLGIFAGVAVVLSATGLYGVISYSVVERTHEMGIRMALGAQRVQILSLILRHGAKLTLIGLGIGLVSALGLTRFLKTMLFGVTATDPLTFVGIALLLAIVALVACYLPARRVTRVDPTTALRHE